MRMFLFLVIALTGCGAGSTKISADRCWTLSIGDQVEGTAILHAYAGQGCIECGAFLTSDHCPGATGFATATDVADKAYEEIVRTSRSDISAFIKRKVHLSGRVVAGSAPGKQMIQAEHLELAD